MRPDMGGPPAATGGPDTKRPDEPPRGVSIGEPGGTRKVDELLDLGREPFEPCANAYFTVAIHLAECERPAGHLGGCGPLREQDLDPDAVLIQPDPDAEDRLADADRDFDVQVWAP